MRVIVVVLLCIFTTPWALAQPDQYRETPELAFSALWNQTTKSTDVCLDSRNLLTARGLAQDLADFVLFEDGLGQHHRISAELKDVGVSVHCPGRAHPGNGRAWVILGSERSAPLPITFPGDGFPYLRQIEWDPNRNRITVHGDFIGGVTDYQIGNDKPVPVYDESLSPKFIDITSQRAFYSGSLRLITGQGHSNAIPFTISATRTGSVAPLMARTALTANDLEIQLDGDLVIPDVRGHIEMTAPVRRLSRGKVLVMKGLFPAVLAEALLWPDDLTIRLDAAETATSLVYARLSPAVQTALQDTASLRQTLAKLQSIAALAEGIKAGQAQSVGFLSTLGRNETLDTLVARAVSDTEARLRRLGH